MIIIRPSRRPGPEGLSGTAAAPQFSVRVRVRVQVAIQTGTVGDEKGAVLYFSDRKFVTRHGRLARRTSGHSCHACSSTCEPILRDACTLSPKGNDSIDSRIGEKVALCVVRVLLGHSQRLSRPYLAGNPRGYPHKCAIAGPIGSLSRITYVGEPITGEPIGKSRVTIKRPELTV